LHWHGDLFSASFVAHGCEQRTPDVSPDMTSNNRDCALANPHWLEVDSPDSRDRTAAVLSAKVFGVSADNRE
jgi:hypothetical protein